MCIQRGKINSQHTWLIKWCKNLCICVGISYRSKIQGLGLYAARDIDKHTMVIEYIGEIIRSQLSDFREKQYEAKVSILLARRYSRNNVLNCNFCRIVGYICSVWMKIVWSMPPSAVDWRDILIILVTRIVLPKKSKSIENIALLFSQKEEQCEEKR